MTIKKRLIINVIISIGMLCILALFWYISYIQIIEEAKKHTIVSELVQQMTDLIIVTEEYLSYKYLRSEQQWQVKYNDILIKLEQTKMFPISIHDKLNELYHSFSQIQLVNDQKEILIQNSASNEEINRKIILEERISANMRLTSREIITQAIIISKAVHIHRDAIFKRNVIMIFAYIFFIIMVSLTNAYILIKRIIPPLNKLVQGASIIESGELKYTFGLAEKESHIHPDDEIGELAIAFNSMTRKLVDSLEKLELEIEERHQAEELLLASEEKLSSITKNSSDHIMLIGQDLKIQFINKTVPGLKKEDIIGKNVNDFIPKDFQKLADDKLQSLFKTGKPTSYQTEYLTKKGEVNYFDVRLSPIIKEGKVVSVISSSNNVTERKRAEDELKRHRVHLEELVKERTRELVKKNAELERFNELFIGREFRIKKLKEKLRKYEP